MPIPTFDKLLRPVLAMAVDQDINRRIATQAMGELFQLTDEEREAYTPSGKSRIIRHRTSWAMTYLTKAGLIANVSPKTYRATDFGRSFLADHPGEIASADLRALEGWDTAWNVSERKRHRDAVLDGLAQDRSPEFLE